MNAVALLANGNQKKKFQEFLINFMLYEILSQQIDLNHVFEC